ncbi:hypothetical protein SGFS_007330 [Streptomyces graminofaciens]|uniref:Uncharacterized protein n=1 Tax=Streptomyces graminofaciens TaxID=68212 RepID=A0ABN5V8X6_9ACTN|nr:hypothetical protein SGFS_007330 [Streptomyces graminofaciens]
MGAAVPPDRRPQCAGPFAKALKDLLTAVPLACERADSEPSAVGNSGWLVRRPERAPYSAKRSSSLPTCSATSRTTTVLTSRLRTAPRQSAPPSGPQHDKKEEKLP